MTAPALLPEIVERLPLIADLAPLGAAPPSPAELAQFMKFGAPFGGYQAPEVQVQTLEAPGPHGPVPVRVYRPFDEPTAAQGLVWAHGGAFIAGDLNMPEADVAARELVTRTGVTVVSVDYRLCHNGTHFPVPHDDVHAAYVWATTAGLLPDGAPCAVGGASAGGNLALGVAQRLRDEDDASLSAVLLAYPVAHDPIPPASAELVARMESVPPVLRFPPMSTSWLNRNFLGPNPPTVPYAFPGLGLLEGLPVTFVSLCEFDDLLPSGDLLVAQLRKDGVEVVEDRVAGVPHGHLNMPGLPAALTTLTAMADLLNRTVRPRDSTAGMS